MVRHHLRYALAGCLLLPVCAVHSSPIDPRSDSLYQQAVPYLQQADDKFAAVTAITPETSAEEKQRSLALAADAGALLKSAMPLLEQAAALDHPVAQYRLGLIYVLLTPADVIEEKACPLLEKSLAQGFAPPALAVSTWCLGYVMTPDYQPALQAIDSSLPRYEKYFPQPAMSLECKKETPVGMGLHWGSSRDYQAEIYRLQGDSNRARRLEFYQKAIDVNGCYRAKRRMEIFRS